MEAALAPIASLSRSAIRPSALWTGRVLNGVAALFLAFDGVMKLARARPVLESCARIGIAPSLARPLGLIETASVALFVLPRTRALGAALLTAWLGGAVLTHLRLGDPLATHTLFPVYMGVLVWGGLYLRDPRVRALVAPVR